MVGIGWGKLVCYDSVYYSVLMIPHYDCTMLENKDFSRPFIHHVIFEYMKGNVPND